MPVITEYLLLAVAVAVAAPLEQVAALEVSLKRQPPSQLQLLRLLQEAVELQAQQTMTKL
jgi:hypothetical protein